MTACCSIAGEMLRTNLKAIFFVVFFKLMRHSGPQFFGKSYRMKMIQNHFMIPVHFFGMKMIQNCFMITVHFHSSDDLPLRGMSLMSKLPFLNFANHFCIVDSLMTPSPYTLQMTRAAQQLFGLDEKQKRSGVENAAFLDILFLSLKSNKKLNYSKRRLAQFCRAERALLEEYFTRQTAQNCCKIKLKNSMNLFCQPNICISVCVCI